MLEEIAHDGSGNGANGEQPEQAAVGQELLLARGRWKADPETVECQLNPGAQKIQNDRSQRARVQSHVKGYASIGPTQCPRKEPQMCAAANGKKFSEALNDGKHH